MTIPPLEELDLLHDHVCSALGVSRRLQILYALNEKPRNVTTLAEDLDIPQPTVSRHLSVLRQRSLVGSERHGTTVVYHIEESRIIDVMDMLRDILRSVMEKHAHTLEENH